MCDKKRSFETEARANKFARRFNQRVYECPICFCWHCTSQVEAVEAQSFRND